MTPEKRLEKIGVQLKPVRPTAGNYVPSVRVGDLIFTAGQGVDEYRGKLGKDLTLEEGYQAARQSMCNLLSVLKHELGDLSKG